MAKDKKLKIKKTKAARKPQPLPRSVQALLKYLGGTDVKLGSASRGGPAQLAPTAINIAVSQQQQQQSQQQQQFVSQRVAPKGQVIGASPLGQIIPQQPIIMQAPITTAETERKIQEQAKQAEARQNELNRKLGILEVSQKEFQQQAYTAYQDVKQTINRRITGDANIFDARNLAAHFGARPILEEQQFEGVSVGEQEVEAGVAGYAQQQYIQNITNPEMTPIERAKRGRKPLTEEQKQARLEEKRLGQETAKIFKKQIRQTEKVKKTLKIPESSAVLLESMQPSQLSGFSMSQTTAVPTQKPTKVIKKAPAPAGLSTSAPDMATQIAFLTGGGAAVGGPQKGLSIADLMGMKIIKKISPPNK